LKFSLKVTTEATHDFPTPAIKLATGRPDQVNPAIGPG